MDKSRQLWQIAKKVMVVTLEYITPWSFDVQEINNKMMATNNELKKLGLSSHIYLKTNKHKYSYPRGNYDEKDSSLFNINFFYIFLNTYSLKECIFSISEIFPHTRLINSLFTEFELPYSCKSTEDKRIILYRIILEEFIPGQKGEEFIPRQKGEEFIPRQKGEEFIPGQKGEEFIRK